MKNDTKTSTSPDPSTMEVGHEEEVETQTFKVPSQVPPPPSYSRVTTQDRASAEADETGASQTSSQASNYSTIASESMMEQMKDEVGDVPDLFSPQSPDEANYTRYLLVALLMKAMPIFVWIFQFCQQPTLSVSANVYNKNYVLQFQRSIDHPAG